MFFGGSALFIGAPATGLISKQEVQVTVPKGGGNVTASITPVATDKAIVIYNGSYFSGDTNDEPTVTLKTISGSNYTEVEVEDVNDPSYTPTVTFDIIELLGVKSINHYSITAGSNTISSVDHEKSIIFRRGGSWDGAGSADSEVYLTSNTNVEVDGIGSGEITVVEFY